MFAQLHEEINLHLLRSLRESMFILLREKHS
jgi:hypothetical protein